MDTKAELLEHLERNTRVLIDANIKRAFEEIDRADFVPEELLHEAYGDYPLPIGHGQTISQPYTVVFMLELLGTEPGEKVLDVGSGSGWTTALLASIVGPTGSVVGVELVPELVALGQKNLAKYPFRNARIVKAQDSMLGLPDSAPFDRILVSAATHKNIPQELLDQLKLGGKMVIPVDNSVVEVKKMENGAISERSHYGFAFVPLVT